MSHENDKPDNANLDELSELYQTTRNDEPGAGLDAAILAQAEEAVAPKRRRPAWIAPVGLAATVLLGVNLAVNLKDHSGDPDVFMESGQIAQREDMPEAMISTPSDEAARTNGIPSRITPVQSGRTMEESKVRSSREGVAPAYPQPSPVPSASIDSASDLLDDAGAPTDRDSFDYYDETAIRGSTEDAVSAEAARPASEQRLKRTNQRSVATSYEQKDENSTPEAMVRAPAAPTAPETSALSSVSKPRSPESNTESARPVVARPPTEQRSVEPGAQSEAMAIQAFERSEDVVIAAAPRFEAKPTPVQEQGPKPDDGELEEIVVTGSSISDIDDSPHRRLTAKSQALRNARQRSNPVISSYAGEADSDQGTATSASPVPSAPIYICDLGALRIDTDAIETAKVEARTVEPPRTALTWPLHIRDLANDGDYVAACTHLAAYQQLFPGLAMIEALPVMIPAKD